MTIKTVFKLSLTIVIIQSCASYTEKTAQIRSAFYARDYQTAYKYLEESDLKNEDRNRLLFRLEEATILDRLNERKKARQLLLEADQIADELYTVSVTKQAASFLVNDAQTDYAGEDYEIVAIHTLLALSFLQDGLLNEARVEAKKINTKLNEITSQRDEKYRKYHEDAFARFLAGLIYEAKGEWDDAIIDYDRALKIYENPDYKNFYRGSVPQSLIRSLYKLSKKRNRSSLVEKLKKLYPEQIQKFDSDQNSNSIASLVVIHEVGQIASKQAKDFIFAFGKQIIRFSYPIIEPRSYSLGATGVSINQKLYKADNVTDLNSIAHFSLEDKRGQMLLKNSARLLAKGQLTEKAYKQFGAIGGLVANAFSAVTETADTRSWTLLPSAFYITRIDVKPGEYEIKITNNGQITQMESIRLEAGQLVFRRDNA